MGEPRIEILDLGFQGVPRAIASFLLLGDGRPVLVETGPGSSLPALVEGLATHGVEPDDVAHVLVTHIHFDHAGAAGWWAQRGATIWVHPKGAPHLVDPSKLEASARRIYGTDMDRLWGEIVPAPAERVRAVEDGETIRIEGLELIALATPGHASHHHVYRLGDVAFTGDLTGIRMPGTSWIDLPAPPPEFDLERWIESLDRLRGEKVERIYRTHFGPFDDVEAEIERTKELVAATARIVGELRAAGLDRDAAVERYGAWVRQRGFAAGADAETLAASAIVNPPDMSVDGVTRYWRKREERAAGA